MKRFDADDDSGEITQDSLMRIPTESPLPADPRNFSTVGDVFMSVQRQQTAMVEVLRSGAHLCPEQRCVEVLNLILREKQRLVAFLETTLDAVGECLERRIQFVPKVEVLLETNEPLADLEALWCLLGRVDQASLHALETLAQSCSDTRGADVLESAHEICQKHAQQTTSILNSSHDA